VDYVRTKQRKHSGKSRDAKTAGRSGFLNGKILALLILLILLIAIPLTLFLTKQSQDIRQRAAGTACNKDTVDVILVIDTSNSMNDGKLAEARVAASKFVDLILPDGSDTKNRIGIATFDNNGGMNRGLSGVEYKEALKKTIADLKRPGDGKGGTCLECAIDKDKGTTDVLGEFSSVPSEGHQRHVIILSDGKINRWMQTDGDIVGSTSNADTEKAREQALAAINKVRDTLGATFSVIQYGGTDNQLWLKNEVAKIPPAGEGMYFTETEASLADMYTNIANILMGGTVVANVFDDLDKDGTHDAGEGPLANVEVSLQYDEASGSGSLVTQTTNASGSATFTNRCDKPQTLTVKPLDGYEGSPADSLVRQLPGVHEGSTVSEQFLLKRLPDRTVAICSPTTINWNQSISLGITVTSSDGHPLSSTPVSWTATDPNILLNPTSAQTNASGSAKTTVTLKPDATAFEGEITASFAGNQDFTSASCKVGLNYAPPAPELTFTATPDFVDPGKPATLIWTTKNVTECIASEGWSGNKNPSGGTESTGPLTEATSYSLTCSGPGGNVSDTVTVDINTPGTRLNLSLLLHGLGAAGDNVLPKPAACQRQNNTIADAEGCLSNQSPLHPERDVKVEVYDKDNQLAASVSGKITYASTSGKFAGSVDLGPNWTTGVYTVKVLTPMFLKRLIDGIQTITNNATHNFPEASLTSSDVDFDNRLSILDYNLIIACYTYPGETAPCNPEKAAKVDVNDDGVNNEFDENLFRRDLIVQYGE
jgi:Mg-chelatase subunit ChlD